MRFPERHNKGQSTDVGKQEKKDEKRSVPSKVRTFNLLNRNQ